MNPDLKFHILTLTRFIYYVTEEEDRFIADFHRLASKYEKRTWVFNSVFGLTSIAQLKTDWATRSHAVSTDCSTIHDALTKAYKDDPQKETNFYIITDPDRWLPDPQVQRRLLNIAHQLHNDDKVIKIFIFVGPRLVIPQKLQRYIEVIHDRGLGDEQLKDLVDGICSIIEIEPPEGITRSLKGLTSYEVESAIAQSLVKTNTETNVPSLQPSIISDFKRRQLSKTDLVSFVDVDEVSFDQVGGARRFKEWARKTKATWSDEGRKFGLTPPRGVLAVGVWGCGKSLSVKALGNAWQLPVVQLEMGRLRSSGVGESEANVYRATNLIESVAPCLIWIDEAEKSLAGNQSSAQSDAGTTARTIGILSTWIQETKAPVCLALTANRVSTLPVELINRMDERFFFDLPSEDERIEILKIHLARRKQDPSRFQLAELAEAAHNMVGREIEQAIGAAMVESFVAGKAHLDHDILLSELKTKPRIFLTMGDDLKELLDWIGFDKERDEGVRARFASEPRRKV